MRFMYGQGESKRVPLFLSKRFGLNEYIKYICGTKTFYDMILLSIILFFVVLEAVHEGLALRGFKKVAAVIEFITLMGVPALILFWPWMIRSDMELSDYYYNTHPWHFWRYLFVHLILGWTFIRFGIFNIIFNIAAGLPIMHIGTVKLIDRLETRIFKKQYPGPSFFIPRILLLLIGIALIFRI